MDASTRVVESGDFGADSERLALEIKQVVVWSEATRGTEAQLLSKPRVEQWSYELSNANLSLFDDQNPLAMFSKSGESDCADSSTGDLCSDSVWDVHDGRTSSGEFEENEHTVTLTRDFYLGRTEVTQGEWRKYAHNNPSSPDFSSCDGCPVGGINWFEAAWYANEMSKKQELVECYTLIGCRGEPGEAVPNRMQCDGAQVNTQSGAPYDCEGFRLPTEAEWEYAYRATTRTAHEGLGVQRPEFRHDRMVLRQRTERTPAGGKKTPNGWLLYDMAGNVSEWTSDWLDHYPTDWVDDPAGPPEAPAGMIPARVIRGGASNNKVTYARAAHREFGYPNVAEHVVGFRLARSAR